MSKYGYNRNGSPLRFIRQLMEKAKGMAITRVSGMGAAVIGLGAALLGGLFD